MKLKKIISELKQIIPNLEDVLFLNNSKYEVAAINKSTKELKIKDFVNGAMKTIPFDKYYEYRHEPGTPVIYKDENGDIRGEVVIKNGKRGISKYKDSNYSGDSERFVIPSDWKNVYKFSEK